MGFRGVGLVIVTSLVEGFGRSTGDSRSIISSFRGRGGGEGGAITGDGCGVIRITLVMTDGVGVVGAGISAALTSIEPT